MPDSSTSRAYTQDEVRDKFLTHVAHLVEFWSNLQNGMPYRTRLEGLAHGILAALDGSAAALPGFVVAPAPHPTDRTYCMEQGENWYPEAPARTHLRTHSESALKLTSSKGPSTVIERRRHNHS